MNSLPANAERLLTSPELRSASSVSEAVLVARPGVQDCATSRDRGELPTVIKSFAGVTVSQACQSRFYEGCWRVAGAGEGGCSSRVIRALPLVRVSLQLRQRDGESRACIPGGYLIGRTAKLGRWAVREPGVDFTLVPELPTGRWAVSPRNAELCRLATYLGRSRPRRPRRRRIAPGYTRIGDMTVRSSPGDRNGRSLRHVTDGAHTSPPSGKG